MLGGMTVGELIEVLGATNGQAIGKVGTHA
jgi:hypothetical protein